MASGVIFAELHVLSGERQESSDLLGVATSPMLSLHKRQRGQLFTVIEPSLPDAESLCRRLIETIEEEYFRATSRSVTTSLKQALTLANERLRAENSKAPPDRQLRVGVSCAAIREGDVYIAQVAPANAFILHGGRVIRVFSTYSIVPDASGNGTNRASDSLGARLDPQVNFGYSPLEEGDLVVLASGAYWKLIPDRYILDAAKHIDPEMAASELYGCYTAHARRPTTSLVVIKIAELPARQRQNGSRGRTELSGSRRMRSASVDAESPDSPAADEGMLDNLVAPKAGADSTVRSRWVPLKVPREERATKQLEQESPRQTTEAGTATPLSLLARLRLKWQRKRSSPYPPGPELGPVGKPSVKLRERRPQSARGDRHRQFKWIGNVATMLALAALFVLLGNMGINAWRSWQLGDPVALVREAQEKRAQASAATDPTSARSLLAKSYELLDRAERAKDDEATRALAASVLADIDRIDRVVRISQATTLVDFSSVVEEKGNVTQLVLDGNNIYVLDEGLDRIYKYILASSGSALEEPGKQEVLVRRGDKLDGAVVGDLLFMTWMPAGQLRAAPALFALESGRSIVAYDPKVGLSRIEVAESQRWGTIQSISGFAGGLYLLDTKLKGVFYYPPTKYGYESQPYTIVDSRAKVDLSKAVDIALDGNLYVLEGSGSIKRFSREGRPLDFDGGLPDGAIKEPKALFANANTRSVYVLDGAGERIVQFSQEGQLQRQFKADGNKVSFKELRDIFVDEAGRKLYALARKSLFVFDMPPMQ